MATTTNTQTYHQSESEVTKAFIREFCTRPTMRAWRMNTGVAKRGKQVVRFGIPGQADWTGIIPVVQVLECPHCGGELSTPPLGVRAEFEMKSSTGQQADEQRYYQAMIEKYNGIYILVRENRDVYEYLAARNITI